MAMSFSPDSTLLATADADTAIRIYDARTGNPRSTALDLLLESLALDFSRDGKSLFVGGADKTISIVDLSPAESETRSQNNPVLSAGLWLQPMASKSPRCITSQIDSRSLA